jgi:hypothetical protein
MADDLTEFNPYDKRLFPKHHQIAKMLLGQKPVTYSTLYDKTGLSPRTLATVRKGLAECGIEVQRITTEDRSIAYRTAKAGKKEPVKKSLDPLAC